MSDQKVPFAQLTAILRLPTGVVRALLNSGLLGFTADGKVAKKNLDQFLKFGTQWQDGFGKRTVPYYDLPTPPNLAGGEQPPSTQTEVQVAPQKVGVESTDEDVGWIAQFYVRPNRFYFASPNELALTGPVPVVMEHAVKVDGTEPPTYLYPDPQKRLALATVVSVPGDLGTAWETAYDAVHPVLDRISSQADVALPVAHSLVIGVPSGVIRIRLPKPGKEVKYEELDLAPYGGEDAQVLRDARALYREAVSSNSPFHQFLTLWRVYHNVVSARAAWRRRHKRRDMRIRDERLPEVFAWQDRKGRTFDEVIQDFRAPYRNAVAHANPQKGRVRSPATAKDYLETSRQVPTMRYMARTVLLNFQHTLRQEGEATKPGEGQASHSG